MAHGFKLPIICNSVLLKNCVDLAFNLSNNFVVYFNISYLFFVYLTVLTLPYILREAGDK